MIEVLQPTKAEIANRIENGESPAEVVGSLAEEIREQLAGCLEDIAQKAKACGVSDEAIVDGLREGYFSRPAGGEFDPDAPPLIKARRLSLVGRDDHLDCEPIEGLMRFGAVSIWHGPGGSGKSLVALSAMVACADPPSAELVFGAPVRSPGGRRPHKSLYISLEDTEKDVRFRLSALLGRYRSVRQGQACDRILGVYRLTGEPKHFLPAIRQHVEQVKPTILVVDNLRRIRPDAEADGGRATTLIKEFESIAQDHDLAVILIHHDRKMPPQNGQASGGKEMAAGSAGLTDAARISVQISLDSSGICTVKTGKSNYTAKASHQFELKPFACDETNMYEVVTAGPAEIDDPLDIFGSADQCKEIADLIADAPADQSRADIRAAGWAGNLAAHQIGLDIGASKRRSAERTKSQNEARKMIARALDAMCSAGLMDVRQVDDAAADGRMKPRPTYVKCRK